MFEDGSNLRNHLSTAYVARDMLELVRKLDEHKRRSGGVVEAPVPHTGQVPIAGGKGSDVVSKLQYIGESYGTFLGQTFASLYPEHVGRMVLEGKLDADNWVSRWEASVDDHERIREYFFQQCHEAGPRCALWRPQDSGARQILERYDIVTAKLADSPAIVARQGHANVITSEELQWGFFTTLYLPHRFFPRFADFLNGILNYTWISQPFWQNPLPISDSFYDKTLAHVLHNGEVDAAIHCSDSPELWSSNITLFEAYLHNLISRFPHAVQSKQNISCLAGRGRHRSVPNGDSMDRSLVPYQFFSPIIGYTRRHP